MITPTEGQLADHKQGRPLQASTGMSVERIHRLRSRRAFWLAIAPLTVVPGATYRLIIRPSHLRWGATNQELAMVLPGDAATPSSRAAWRAGRWAAGWPRRRTAVGDTQ